MDLAALKTFLEVTGPWGLIALFLFLWWQNQRKDDKDVAALVTMFEAFLIRFGTHDATCVQYQQELTTLTERVTQNGRGIDALTEELRRAKKAQGRGGSA
jgi:hypothetical protein